MGEKEATKRVPVLDPIDRVSEIVFGILMAVSFTGTLSVATAGDQQVRTMMYTALGCNLAWGLTDAVMYLVRAGTERHRTVMLLRKLQVTQADDEAHRMIADALPPFLANHMPSATLHTLRERLLVLPLPSAHLGVRDYAAAFGVFALVVLATFPVVVPFIFIRTPSIALRVSNALALATLFICGYALGRYTGERAWIYGIAMTAIGIGLVIAIVTLGG